MTSFLVCLTLWGYATSYRYCICRLGKELWIILYDVMRWTLLHCCYYDIMLELLWLYDTDMLLFMLIWLFFDSIHVALTSLIMLSYLAYGLVLICDHSLECSLICLLRLSKVTWHDLNKIPFFSMIFNCLCAYIHT